MKYTAIFKITGRARATIEADSLEEAQKKADAQDVEDGELIEWDFDDVVEVEKD